MSATDRLPEIPLEAMNGAQRDAVADYKRTRKTTIFEGPFIPLLRSPELMTNVQRVGEYLRYRSALPRRLSEMAILITARQWCQQFEWCIHSADAAAAGLTTSVIDAIADGRRPTEAADDEAALHDFCLELLQNKRVSDPTYARAVALFNEQGVIDLVGILGYYSLLAMIMNTARTPVRTGMTPMLERFPE